MLTGISLIRLLPGMGAALFSMVMKGVDVVVKEIENEKKQFRYAGAVALTRTAKRSQEAIKKEMKHIFDKPTPYTINATRIRPAKKDKLQADVLLKDESYKGVPATKYLWPQVHGGKRQPKRSENLLRSKGYLANDEYIVPGKGIKLNAYGNVSRGVVQKVLSGLAAQGDKHQNTPTEKRGLFFVAKINGIRAIWMRTGDKLRGITPIFIFIKNPSYDKKLNFYEISEKTFDKYFDIEFKISFDKAISTSK